VENRPNSDIHSSTSPQCSRLSPASDWQSAGSEKKFRKEINSYKKRKEEFEKVNNKIGNTPISVNKGAMTKH
jgi:hypothetical protein